MPKSSDARASLPKSERSEATTVLTIRIPLSWKAAIKAAGGATELTYPFFAELVRRGKAHGETP